MKILVTGGLGKVGRHVVDALAPAHELRLFGRTPPEAASTRHSFMRGDILDPVSVKRACEGMDAVAHIAANPWFSPTTFNTNAVGTYNILEACRELEIARFVMAGSDWGVGKHYLEMNPPVAIPVVETDPSRPCDNYGLSKVVNEVTCEMYSRVYSMEIAVLRLTAVWMAEGTDTYLARGEAGLPETIAENAKYWWSYVDVRDVASAFRMSLESPDLPAYGAYFISARDTVISVPTMEAIKRFWPKVKVREGIPGCGSVLSVASAKKAFGWEPVRSWRAK